MLGGGALVVSTIVLRRGVPWKKPHEDRCPKKKGPPAKKKNGTMPQEVEVNLTVRQANQHKQTKGKERDEDLSIREPQKRKEALCNVRLPSLRSDS